MKKLLLILICFFLVSFENSKNDWTKFYSNNNGDFYLDKKKLKKRENMVYVWTLSDYLEPISNNFFSTIEYQTVDCLNKKSKDLKTFHCEKPMGNGKCRDDSFLNSGNFSDLMSLPHSFNQSLLEEICL